MKVKFPIIDNKRKCSRCLTEKPIDDFYDHGSGVGGFNAYKMAECKDCFKLRMRSRHKRQKEYAQ